MYSEGGLKVGKDGVLFGLVRDIFGGLLWTSAAKRSTAILISEGGCTIFLFTEIACKKRLIRCGDGMKPVRLCRCE